MGRRARKTDADVANEVLAGPASERQTKLDAIILELEKQYGEGAMGTLAGRNALRAKVTGIIHTGSFGLDEALGVGGYPRGRIIEIYGAESSGKTTLTLHAIAEMQRLGGVAAFVDAEHALDPGYASALGVNLEEVLVSQPDSGERALNIVETLVRSGTVDLVVVDSVAALVPQAELDGEMGDHHPGAQARLMSQALRKLTALTSKTNCTIIFINQTREKIGVMFGSPKTTSGGNALKFYASIRLEVARIGSVKKGEVVSANRTKVVVKKNKVAPPFRTCEFEIEFGRGISWPAELLDAANALGLVTRAGAWYRYQDANFAMGKDRAATWLRENLDVAQTLREAVSGALSTQASADTAEGG